MAKTKGPTKTARRRAARDVKYLLGLYLYTLEPWYVSGSGGRNAHTPEEQAMHQRGYLLMARKHLDHLLALEDLI
jgi:hypothetical protein